MLQSPNMLRVGKRTLSLPASLPGGVLYRAIVCSNYSTRLRFLRKSATESASISLVILVRSGRRQQKQRRQGHERQEFAAKSEHGRFLLRSVVERVDLRCGDRAGVVIAEMHAHIVDHGCDLFIAEGGRSEEHTSE